MTKTSKIIVLISCSILILLSSFFIWQSSLGKKHGNGCGGDWNYDVQCPFGTSCTEVANPLEGGSCKPWINL